MLIVGLHNYHDSGVCLIRDGTLVAAASEERFNREKGSKGVPSRALDWLLDAHGLTIGDVDRFVYAWYGGRFELHRFLPKLASRIAKSVADDPSCEEMIKQRMKLEACDERVRQAFIEWLATRGGNPSQLAFLDHHTGHAWSAFACSPFDEAMVFTLDGRGNYKSGAVFEADCERGVSEIDFNLTLDSLAFLYGSVTELLGFQPLRDEGKVMALAAYGDPERTLPVFRKMIDWCDDAIVSHPGLYAPFNKNLQRRFRDIMAPFDARDIAAGVQAHTEAVVCQWVRHWLTAGNPRGLRNVCLAGGLFANVRVNRRVAELAEVDNIFVFPHMGDGGLPVGAACHAWFEASGEAKVALPNVYLGPEYGDEAIEAALLPYGRRLSAERQDERVRAVVCDLQAGRVVGYFDGRMEYGPRALGARSILARASDPSMSEQLNRRLRRTDLMPFAPVSPAEYAAESYRGWRPADIAARFMTRTYDCDAAFQKRHPAVVHADGTARPQIVDAAHNGAYYSIVKQYCDQTGERGLINTSFNVHEEPIVCSPRDAIEGLLEDAIDVLYLGSWRVTPGQGLHVLAGGGAIDAPGAAESE